MSDFALSKLYSNSILSTLNARGGWKVPSSTARDNVLFDRSSVQNTERNCMQVRLGRWLPLFF